VSFFFEIKDVSTGRGGVVKIMTLFACVPMDRDFGHERDEPFQLHQCFSNLCKLSGQPKRERVK
jgi:hypothetical protein